MAFQRFTRRTAEAAAGTGEARGALKFLGIALKDSEGRLRPAGAMLEEVADAMAKIQDPALRVRVAFKLFDSEGVSMVNMLQDGSKSIRDAGDEAERLGVITEEDARASEEFTDSLARMQQAALGLRNEIGGELIPRITEVIGKFTEWMVENKPGLLEQMAQAGRDLASVYRMIKGAIEGVVEAGRDLRTWIDETFPEVGKMIDKFADWAGEIGLVKGAAILLVAFIGKGLIVAIIGLIAPLTALAALLIANPFVLLVAALAGGVYLIYDNWDGIVKYFEDIWKGIKDAFDWEWLNKAASAIEGIFGGGGAAAFKPAFLGDTPSAPAAAAPSLFAPSAAFKPAFLGDTPSAGRSKASVTVDFRNMPRGTRTETRADSDTDLEVTTGYAMQGAQ